GLVVASEPLADDQQGWTLIPPGSVVHLDSNGVSSSEVLM
ncbi:MAG: class II glutamine amidotransferase, partial [Paucibacter sp.]|nr:class II glutamine amidotransferase [Roseateles sp.]